MIMRQMSRTVSFFFQLPHPPALTSSPRDSSPLNLPPPSSVAQPIERIPRLEHRNTDGIHARTGESTTIIAPRLGDVVLRAPPSPSPRLEDDVLARSVLIGMASRRAVVVLARENGAVRAAESRR